MLPSSTLAELQELLLQRSVKSSLGLRCHLGSMILRVAAAMPARPSGRELQEAPPVADVLVPEWQALAMQACSKAVWARATLDCLHKSQEGRYRQIIMQSLP